MMPISTPVVSVIMLTHNRGNYLGEAIASVLHQEFTNIELIVVDDGSTDGTEQIIETFKDVRLRYYRFAKTGEISTLRNKGINYSNGEFIAFIDSDDHWTSEKLREQLELFNRYPTAGFGFCDVIEFRDKGSILRSGIYKHPEGAIEFVGNIFLPLVQNQYVIYPSSAIFKKECLKKVGMINENLKPGETEFFTRLAYAYDCVISYRKMVKIRKHDGNSSDQLRVETVREMQFCLHQLKSEGKISDAVFREMTAWYHYLGGMAYQERKLHHQARQEFISYLRHKPFKVKAWLRVLFTFIPAFS